jgi:hypothetical protein
MSRAAPIVLRLSMIFALMDGTSIIDEVHLKAAFAIWRYAEQSVKSIFGNNDEGDATEKKVHATIIERPGISRKELCDAFHRNVKMTKIDEALRRLEVKQKVFAKRDEATGGRPAERWYPMTKTERRNDATTETTEGASSSRSPTSVVSFVPSSSPENAKNTAYMPSVVSVVSVVASDAETKTPTTKTTTSVVPSSEATAMATEDKKTKDCQPMATNPKDEVIDKETFYAELHAIRPE